MSSLLSVLTIASTYHRRSHNGNASSRTRLYTPPNFSVLAGQETPPAKIVIVGGGVTAGTLAKSLSERGHSVALIARNQFRTEQFDFSPVWLGPKALAEFASEADFRRRYDIIQQNRGEGSITPDIMEALIDAPNIDLYPETCIRKHRLGG